MPNMPVLKIKRLHADAIMSKYQTEGAAGFDLHALESLVLQAGKRVAVKTGLAIEIPKGYELQIRPRSGLAINHGISVLNTPGTIDCDYRGEIMVILINHSQEDFHIHKHDRIAQAVLNIAPQATLKEVQTLSQSERGEKGFGSSGIKHKE